VKTIDNIKQDYNLFIEIQVNKYLMKCGKDDFDSDQEVHSVLDKMINVYNEKIAGEHLRLDNLNGSAKVAWFKSIDIDFNNIQDEKEEINDFSDEDFKDALETLDDRLNFLPKGSLGVLLFGLPLLNAYGFPFERFKSIILGESPKDFEQDLLDWMFDTTVSIMGSIFEKTKTERKKKYEDALDIAQDFLSESVAEQAVKEIHDNIKETEQIKNPKKKKKKR